MKNKKVIYGLVVTVALVLIGFFSFLSTSGNSDLFKGSLQTSGQTQTIKARAGETVVISGSGFNRWKGNKHSGIGKGKILVAFGGVPERGGNDGVHWAYSTSVTDTAITVKVPTGAKTGIIYIKPPRTEKGGTGITWMNTGVNFELLK